jgi:hypothetical protein
VSATAPPLAPFGLVLHRDGSWTHEGVRVTHPRLRAAFDRSVRFLPEEGVYVVQLGRFRGQIEVEEAGFFVREVDLAHGRVRLSDGSVEALDVASLRPSRFDGAWLCTVKRALRPGGLPARFTHASQAEVLGAVEERAAGPCLRLAGEIRPLPGELAAEC